jgi:hypothetical protein
MTKGDKKRKTGKGKLKEKLKMEVINGWKL